MPIPSFLPIRGRPGRSAGRAFEDVEGYDDMVMLRDIALESHCEHHMVAILGKVHIAYMPVTRSLAFPSWRRLLKFSPSACRPGNQATRSLTTFSACEPASVAILVDAKHQCMTTRGIKPDVATICTQFTGFSLKTRVWKPASLP